MNPLEYKLGGGALYYAIIVILLLSLFSSGFILLNRLWFVENALFLKNTELNDNLDSVDQWLRAGPGLVPTGQAKELDLFGDSSLVKVEAQSWGLLRLIKSSARWRSLTIKRNTLYSGINNKGCALYLSDNNKFLSLVGKCQIKGDCCLPALGIRAGEMDGGTFIGTKMIDGTIAKSSNSLPKLSPELLQLWYGYWDAAFRSTDSIVDINSLNRNPDCAVSFNSNTLVIEGESDGYLQNVNLSGNIIVASTGKITISSSARLQDILVFAKTIQVANDVHGSFQLFARDQLIIGDNCRLRYPSFAVCLANQTSPKMTIGKNSVISGGVLIDSMIDNPMPGRLEMTEGNKITGIVYVNGEVGFAGQIDGGLYCNRFFISTPRGYYENFLKDAVINSESVPARFGSFSIDDSPDQLKLVKLCL